MAKIKGTNGDDTLTGTAGDDTIFGYLGMDSVNGGAGFDVLTIDYSAVASSVFPGNMALAADGTWSGGVSSGVSGGAVNVTAFGGVERIIYTASGDVDYLYVDLGTLALDRTRLNLDGAGGANILALGAAQVAASSALTLTVAGDGTIKSNAAVLANWGTFDIALNAANGNKVTLGAGDDVVRSSGGVDTINLGGGDDQWTGDYATRGDALTINYSAATGVGVASAGATVAQVKNVEHVYLTLGAGDDIVYLGDGAGSLYGGTGDNRLFVTADVTAAPLSVTVGTFSDGSLRGTLAEKSAPTPINFAEFRVAFLSGNAGADSFVFDAATRAVANNDYLVILDGSGGTDDVTLDLRAEGAASLVTQAAGIGYGGLSFAGKANTVAFRRMEALTVKFGAGDDRVALGVTTSMAIDGGAGLDTLDCSATAGYVQIDLRTTGVQSVAGVSLSLTAVEGVVATVNDDIVWENGAANVISLGSGADTLRCDATSAGGADTFDGGAGVDLIDYTAATAAVTVNLSLTGAQNTGGGGVDTVLNFERVYGTSLNDTLTGNDAANVLYGAVGDDVLEGLGGNDTLYGYTGSDTASYAHATAAVTVSLANTASQNTGAAGSDTLSDIENLIGSAFDDTLTGSSGNNVITGGLGTDIMTGNGGFDRFVFRTAAETSTEFLESDLITDFVGPGRGGGDLIDLSAIDANRLTVRSNEAFTFIGTAAFSGVAGQLHVVNSGNGLFVVEGDTNGDKVADFDIYVQSTDTAILKGDFVL